MGVVYHASQKSPKRQVALKIIHPLFASDERLRRFRQEAEVLGRLQHPCIAQVFEAGTFEVGRGPQPYFSMEFVDGANIREFVRRENANTQTKLRLIAEISRAIQHAHDQGIVHRDLKPENVMITKEGRPKILDFGIARARGSSATLSTVLTDEGQVLGTLAYMAPEQLDGQPETTTHQVDVFALGVILFELLSGRTPHVLDELPVSAAMRVISSGEVPKLGDVVPGLKGDVETIVGKALEPDPKRRYSSAMDIADDIERFLEHRPIVARPPSRLYLANTLCASSSGLGDRNSKHRLALTVGLIATL